MFSPWARDFIRIASVDSAVKWVPGGDNLMKGVQCYELFGGIALKIHTFSFFHFSSNRFLISSFSKPIFILSIYVFPTIFLISFSPCLLPLSHVCWNVPETAFTYCRHHRCSFLFNTVNFCLIFSHSEYHLPLFFSLKPCIWHTIVCPSKAFLTFVF